jgi:hypothetical protein
MVCAIGDGMDLCKSPRGSSHPCPSAATPLPRQGLCAPSTPLWAGDRDVVIASDDDNNVVLAENVGGIITPSFSSRVLPGSLVGPYSAVPSDLDAGGCWVCRAGHCAPVPGCRARRRALTLCPVQSKPLLMFPLPIRLLRIPLLDGDVDLVTVAYLSGNITM